MITSVTPDPQFTLDMARIVTVAMLVETRRAHLNAPVGVGRTLIRAAAATRAAALTGKPIIVVTDLVRRAFWEQELARVDDSVDVLVLTPHRLARRPSDITSDAILVIDVDGLCGQGVPRAAARAVVAAVKEAEWVFTSGMPLPPGTAGELVQDLTVVEFPDVLPRR